MVRLADGKREVCSPMGLHIPVHRGSGRSLKLDCRPSRTRRRPVPVIAPPFSFHSRHVCWAAASKTRQLPSYHRDLRRPQPWRRHWAAGARCKAQRKMGPKNGSKSEGLGTLGRVQRVTGPRLCPQLAVEDAATGLSKELPTQHLGNKPEHLQPPFASVQPNAYGGTQPTNGGEPSWSTRSNWRAPRGGMHNAPWRLL